VSTFVLVLITSIITLQVLRITLDVVWRTFTAQIFPSSERIEAAFLIAGSLKAIDNRAVLNRFAFVDSYFSGGYNGSNGE
jgi:hypothetical protein